MSQGEFPLEMFTQFKQLEHEYIGYQSLTDVPRTLTYREDTVSFDSYKHRSTPDVVSGLRATDNIFAQCQLWGILLEREGPMYEVGWNLYITRLRIVPGWTKLLKRKTPIIIFKCWAHNPTSLR